MTGGRPARTPLSSRSRAAVSAVGRAYAPTAATSGRDEREHPLGEDLEPGRIPVERVQDQVIHAAEGLDLPPDALGNGLGLAEQVELLPVLEIHAAVDREELRGGLGALAGPEHVDEVRVHLLQLVRIA